jgi:glycosyltransferase involved in cell wall biosynthesis
MLGSGKTRLRWSEGLRRLGHDVDVLEPRTFELWPGARRGLRFRQAVGALGAVLRRVRAQDYDLVEFFGGEFGLATARLSRAPRRPLIVAHTDGFELLASERARVYDPPAGPLRLARRWYRHHAHDRLSRAAFVYADAFVTGCEADRKRVIELQLFVPERTAVIAPGVDGEYLAARRQPSREARVAFVGTWIPRKGVRYIVDVMNEVLQARPGLKLDLYGTAAPAHDVLQFFAPAVRRQITVFRRLSNEDLATGLSKAQVFFFPAQYEGFGMALAEAMACGCAPVTTPTGFGAELRDGAEALICAFDDAPAMKRAVSALLDDAALRARVAAAAAKRVQSLTWAAQIGNLEATYVSWLAQHATDAAQRSGI